MQNSVNIIDIKQRVDELCDKNCVKIPHAQQPERLNDKAYCEMYC
jgi:hypothetical protein